MAGIPPDSGQSDQTLPTAALGPLIAVRHSSLERPGIFWGRLPAYCKLGANPPWTWELMGSILW